MYMLLIFTKATHTQTHVAYKCQLLNNVTPNCTFAKKKKQSYSVLLLCFDVIADLRFCYRRLISFPKSGVYKCIFCRNKKVIKNRLSLIYKRRSGSRCRVVLLAFKRYVQPLYWCI